jgi:hypothetical protein
MENRSLTVAALFRAAIARPRARQAKPPAPPMQKYDFPLVAQAVSPASYIDSQLLTVAALFRAAIAQSLASAAARIRAATVRERFSRTWSNSSHV